MAKEDGYIPDWGRKMVVVVVGGGGGGGGTECRTQHASQHAMIQLALHSVLHCYTARCTACHSAPQDTVGTLQKAPRCFWSLLV